MILWIAGTGSAREPKPYSEDKGSGYSFKNFLIAVTALNSLAEEKVEIARTEKVTREKEAKKRHYQ